MKKSFLHIGCGQNTKSDTTNGFKSDLWDEKRVDINPDVSPDIVADMLDMSMISSSSVDAVFSSHNLEHLYPYQVQIALKEFYRVINDLGFIVITCPNLKPLGKFLSEDKALDTLYESPAGPITAIDVLYGFRPSLAMGNHYMAHRCGFTKTILVSSLNEASFKSTAAIERDAPFFDLWVIASKQTLEKEKLLNMVRDHFPIKVP